MLRWLIGIILGKIICKSSNWQHIERLKIAILGANWQFLDWKGWPNVHILFCVNKTHQVLVICNENKEICVANLIIKFSFFR